VTGGGGSAAAKPARASSPRARARASSASPTRSSDVQPPPVVAPPQLRVDAALVGEHRRVGAGGVGEQRLRRAVLDDLPVGHHDDARQLAGLLEVVRHAEEGRLGPPRPDPPQQRRAALAVEAAQRLVEDDEADLRPQQRATEADPLALAARQQRPALAELGLEPVGQVRHQLEQVGVAERRPDAPERPVRPVLRAVQQVVDQRLVPQHHGGVDPRRLAPQRREAGADERLAVDAQLAARGPVPAEQQPDQRRLARARGTYDRQVLARLHAERDVGEHRGARRDDADALHGDRYAGRAISAPGPADRRAGRRILVRRADRLEQTQRPAAVGGVLEDELADALTELRQQQRPVDEQQHRPDLAGHQRVPQRDRDDDREADDGLERLNGDRGADEVEACAHPLDEQLLMLAGDRAAGPVRADRDQAEQRVEVNAPERAAVGAEAEVALGQRRERGERRGQQEQRRAGGPHRAAGVEPGDADDRQQQRADRAHELGAEFGQAAQAVHRVQPLGHVGGQARLEVAGPEARHLRQERDAQPGLEPAADPEQLAGQHRLEQQ
jgi:hypothetical protein